MELDLFSIEEKDVSYSVGEKRFGVKYPNAVPKTKLINVLTDFPWKNSGDVNEVPFLRVKEYTLTWGQTITNLQRILSVIGNIYKNGTLDPYLIMYTAKPTDFEYIFPHLIKDGDPLRDIKNSWEVDSNSGGNWLEDWASKLSKTKFGGLVSNAIPGTGFEEIETYKHTTKNDLVINFPLYNTRDVKSAFRNYSLVMLLAFQNLKTRTSFMTFIPPKLYTITNDYHGGIYMPVACISDYNVKSIGTTRVLKEYGNIIIPEAYDVTIKFSELLSQSSNILKGVIDGSRIQVIEDADVSLDNLKKETKDAIKGLSNVFGFSESEEQNDD
jgi:hypothetical protein